MVRLDLLRQQASVRIRLSARLLVDWICVLETWIVIASLVYRVFNKLAWETRLNLYDTRMGHLNLRARWLLIQKTYFEAL